MAPTQRSDPHATASLSPTASDSSTEPADGPLKAIAKPAGVRKIGLFDLPQELQDIIFDYAYPPVEDLGLISKSGWEKREFDRRLEGNAYTVQAFPGPKIGEFLVSKSFFEVAARTWIGNQWVRSSWPWVLDRAEWMDPRDTLLAQLGTKVYWSRYMEKNEVTAFPRAKFFKLVVDVESFQHPSKYPWEVLFDDDEIMATKVYNDVVQLRGLIDFQAEPYVIGFRLRSNDTSKLDMWRANVQKFEDLVKKQVLKPKQVNSVTFFDPELGQNLVRLSENINDFGRLVLDGIGNILPALAQMLGDFFLWMGEQLAWPDLAGGDYPTIREFLARVDKYEGKKAPLTHADIPDTKDAIFTLYAVDPARFLDWVLAVKEAESRREQLDQASEIEPEVDSSVFGKTPSNTPFQTSDLSKTQASTSKDVDLALISKTLKTRAEDTSNSRKKLKGSKRMQSRLVPAKTMERAAQEPIDLFVPMLLLGLISVVVLCLFCSESFVYGL